MRKRDLRALEFDKVLALLTPLAVSEPGQRKVAALAPATDADEVRRRLRATSELVELRAHAGSLPMGELKDQTPLFGVAAGHLVLGDPLTPAFAVAVALVAAGLLLVNRPR